MAKILWFDCETTGLDPNKNQIIQMAGIIEVDGKEKESFNLKCAPFHGILIDSGALKVNKRTKEEIKAWPNPKKTYAEFNKILRSHINKFNPLDKFIMAGQNIFFDKGMLYGLAKLCGDSFLGSFFHGATLDLLTLASIASMNGMQFRPNFKLSTICATLGISLGEGAHDAMADIRATRDCAEYLIGYLKGKKIV